jgi:hypothetical protein
MAGDDGYNDGTASRRFKKVLQLLKTKPRNSAKETSSVAVAPVSATSTELSTVATADHPPDDLVPEEQTFADATRPTSTTPSMSADNPSTNNNPPNPATALLGDDERTKAKYAAAAKRLKDVLERGRSQWKDFKPPDTDGGANTMSQLRDQLEKMLNTWKASGENSNLWSKGKVLLGQIFVATSPFMKHVLLVAKDAAQVPCPVDQ